MNDYPQPNSGDGNQEELVAYLDGELDADTSRVIEQRLAEDEDYRRELRQLQRAWDLLDQLPRAEPTETFTRSTVEMVAVTAADEVETAQSVKPARRWPAWGTLAAAVIASSLSAYAVVATVVQQRHQRELREVPVIESVDLYRHIDSLEFVRQVDDSGLFAEEGDHARLSPAEGKELLRKKQRFERLEPAAQDRMRRLHAALSSDPEHERLQSVIVRYNEWLATLSPGERADLLDLPPDQRIDRIREIEGRRGTERLPQFGSLQLEPEDARHILTWFDSFVTRHERELLERLPADVRERIQRTPDAQLRRRFLMMTLQRRGPKELPIPVPQPDEVEALAAKLSPRAGEALRRAAEPTQKMKLLQQWVRAAVASRVMPPQVGQEELRQFYTGDLTDEQRERLESLPRERMHQELRRMYFHHRWKPVFGQRRPFPHGRPGPGRRGDKSPPFRGPDRSHDKPPPP